MSLNNSCFGDGPNGPIIIGTLEKNFPKLWEKAWRAWCTEDYKIDHHNPKEWKKRFGSTIITYDKNNPYSTWAAIKFKSKKQYFLFVLEWS